MYGCVCVCMSEYVRDCVCMGGCVCACMSEYVRDCIRVYLCSCVPFCMRPASA